MNKDFVCQLKCGIPVSNNLSKIIVHGAKEHNLKNICFEIPKGKLVALTGPSGSGKSSIASDILQKECIRQYLESLGMVTDHLEKAKVDNISGLSPSIGITQKVTDFNPRSTVGTKSGILTILRNMFAIMGYQKCNSCEKLVKQPLQDKNKLKIIEIENETNSTSKKTKKSYFNCPHCSQQLEKLKMSHFSSNILTGACQTCKGAGDIISIDQTRLINQEETIRNNGIDCWDKSLAAYYENIILAARKYYNFKFEPNIPIKNYTKEQRNFLLYGINCPDFIKEYKDIPVPKKVSDGNFEGVIPQLLNLYKKNPEKVSNNIKKYIINSICLDCKKTGLSKMAREVIIDGQTIIDLSKLNLTELFNWINNLDQKINNEESQIFAAFSDALKSRISNLIEVGLDYLTLDRSLPSLSAGESQRVRLASLLGSGLTGVLYVLDEPTTGLHPNDNIKLLKTIRKLQEMGNTVLIIEHDIDIIKQADYILDMGLAGGNKGGEIIASGTPKNLISCTKSVTSKYLSRKNIIKLDNLKNISRENKYLIIRGAKEHNLKNIDINIPVNQFVVMTGVSGSGKSTFLFDILDKVARKYFNNAMQEPGKYDSVEGLNYFKRVVTVDQATIGNSKSTRSNIATITKLFDLIRDLFAALPTSKAFKFSAQDFSFNISNQRCENCNGAGSVDIDMTFMPDIEIECPVCLGERFDDELLSIKFKNYNISNILDMTVSEALAVFKQEARIFSILDLLRQVGLEYLKLGQSTSTLSGGEAQRIKLATELSKSESGNTLYLLDEPTTGLHAQEVERLIDIFKKLVSKGNTVVIIEHNLDIICNADTIIDFGPGGGLAGGKIVATGAPQEIMKSKNSLTGKCLKDYLELIK